MKIANRAWLPLALAAAMGLSACSQGASATEVGGTAPEGFQRVSNSSEGFSMVVPESWTVVDPDDMDSDAALDEMLAAVPELGDMAAEMRMALDQGVVFWAFDFANATVDFVDNINVIKAPRYGASAQTLRDTNVQQVRSMLDPSATGSIETSMQGYEVVRLSYASSSFGTTGLGAIVLTDDTQWVITLTNAYGSRPDFEFDVVVDLFREL